MGTRRAAPPAHLPAGSWRCVRERAAARGSGRDTHPSRGLPAVDFRTLGSRIQSLAQKGQSRGWLQGTDSEVCTNLSSWEVAGAWDTDPYDWVLQEMEGARGLRGVVGAGVLSLCLTVSWAPADLARLQRRA